MKKFFSVLVMAMVAVFAMTSCSKDNDSSDPTVPEVIKELVFIPSYSGSVSGQDVFAEFVNAKANGAVKASVQLQVLLISYMSNKKDAAVAAIKALANYKDELDAKMAASSSVSSFNISITDGSTTLYEYQYTKSFNAKYATTDANGKEWVLTLTPDPSETSSSASAHKGSIVVPVATNGVEAGTYDGSYIVNSGNVTFASTLKIDDKYAVQASYNSTTNTLTIAVKGNKVIDKGNVTQK